jgi:hypothetical protein
MLMTHDAELNVTPPTEPTRSAAAERMRRHRQRRQNGMRCLMVELREAEIDALVHKRLLVAEMPNEVNAVLEALYEHLEQTLDARP